MRSTHRALLLSLLAFTPIAGADEDPASVEHLLGATDLNAAIGNGGLTAGMSSQGELTVLRWPSPSYFQHDDFSTSNALDARMQPHFGARDDQGSFVGVFVDDGAGGKQFAWARDAGWVATQAYVADDSNQLVTTLQSASLRVTVRITDAVPHDLDVLVRHVEVIPDAGFTPAALRVVYFENFSPTIEKTDFYPTDQVADLAQRDYALGVSAMDQALVHFSIPRRPPTLVAPLDAAKTPADVDSFLSANIRGNAATTGMYLLVGGDHAPDGFQCGWDQPSMPNASAPTDAYDDAIATLGALSSAPAVTQHADGALAWNLPAAGGAVDVFIAAGATLDDAEKTLAQARTRGGDKIRTDDLAFWQGWLAPAKLPPTTDPDRLRLAKRALLSIAVGRDRTSGAIVASIASQPEYDLDWPRDGAFIDYALDLAGYTDWVTQHRKFFARVQRQSDGDDSAGGDAFAGSWAMNFYADGHPGGPVPLEIDEVGLALWMHVEHAAFLDEASRPAYLSDIYPSVHLGAELLTTCVDPSGSGLQCLENEDDHVNASISLHGAVAVRLGLDMAVRAAMALGKLDDARRWRARLDQLDAAIDKSFVDPQLGYVGQTNNSVGGPTGGGTGAVAWTLWPVELRAPSDPRMVASAHQIATAYQPFFDRMTAGGSYHGKGLVALARWAAATGDTAQRDEVRAWIDLMVKQVATPGTGHFGESYFDNKTSFTDVTAIPHLWEGTLIYTALMASYAPDTFAPPPLATDVVPPAPASGCAVGSTGSGAPGRSIPLALALLLVGAVALRSRSRSTRRG